MRYEKLGHAFLALNHLADLAAAIIALRKIELPVNIIDGYILIIACSCGDPEINRANNVRDRGGATR